MDAILPAALDGRGRQARLAEQRIKRFLDGCAYLLLRDAPEGTLTDYKEIMRGRKEIDVSSCPSWIADRLDAGGHTLSCAAREEQERFQVLLDRLDEKAHAYISRRKRRGKAGDIVSAPLNACARSTAGEDRGLRRRYRQLLYR